MLLEGRGGGGLKVVVIFGREGQGWGGWGHRRHGRGVGKLGALQEACSGNPPRDVNALSSGSLTLTLRHLAKVPSSEDNNRLYYESQVLRHIVSFVGVGFDLNC